MAMILFFKNKFIFLKFCGKCLGLFVILLLLLICNFTFHMFYLFTMEFVVIRNEIVRLCNDLLRIINC